MLGNKKMVELFYDLVDLPNTRLFTLYLWAHNNGMLDRTNLAELHDRQTPPGIIVIEFENEEDAVAFKLVWGDEFIDFT